MMKVIAERQARHGKIKYIIEKQNDGIYTITENLVGGDGVIDSTKYLIRMEQEELERLEEFIVRVKIEK